jgi:predicted nucleotidyltransferase
MLDRPALERIVRDGPRPVFATISGAHLYGFASPDSDVDLRGAYVIPVREALGLTSPPETHSVESQVEGIELDFVAHDIRKFARMMIQHNGYALEQLCSPLVVFTGPDHEELCEIGRGCVTRSVFRHYRGFAQGRRKLLAESGATVKHLLYAYRVYLSGIHTLRTGEIEANLLVLNDEFRMAQIVDLIARKKEGSEKMGLADGEVETHNEHLDALEARLEEAHHQSTLPEEPTSRRELEDFVVRVRLKTLET